MEREKEGRREGRAKKGGGEGSRARIQQQSGERRGSEARASAPDRGRTYAKPRASARERGTPGRRASARETALVRGRWWGTRWRRAFRASSGRRRRILERSFLRYGSRADERHGSLVFGGYTHGAHIR